MSEHVYPEGYLPRIVDKKVERYLKIFGAIEIAGTKLQLTGDIGSKLFGENYWKIISQYIENTRDSAKATAEESLDESWDAYVKLLSLQEDVTPKRVVPTVCINAFQNGSYSDEMEDICHVEK